MPFSLPNQAFLFFMTLKREEGKEDSPSCCTRLSCTSIPESVQRILWTLNWTFPRRPVDFVAEGIAGVASAQRTGCGLYHVVNPHWDDNVSLDTFLGWIQNAGYPLKQISDYSQW